VDVQQDEGLHEVGLASAHVAVMQRRRKTIFFFLLLMVLALVEVAEEGRERLM
jgi:hypothetical protein